MFNFFFELNFISADNCWKPLRSKDISYAPTPGITPSPNDRTDEYVAAPSNTGNLATGAAEYGMIEAAGDKDWFKIDNLVAGRSYRASVEGNGSSPLSNTFFS